jgi:adenylate cyclase
MTDRAWKILAVDDVEQNVRLLKALLTPRGYQVITACDGLAALEQVRCESPDLILLDVLMPQMDGYQVARQLRADEATRFLPIVMVTSLDAAQEKVKAIEAGADDFITKPVNQHELLARVRSLLRIKEYHDTIESQKAELAKWNKELEDRVQRQVAELERVARLRRFLTPQLAELIVSSQQEQLLDSHRREIAAVYADMRNSTGFADTTEPEEVLKVMREYHSALSEIIIRHQGTTDNIAGDGMMVFFNDPFPVPNPAECAVRMAMAMRERVSELQNKWRKRGFNLGFGVGIALGYATLGVFGSEDFFHYGGVGTVLNLAARLSDEATDGQILISQRVLCDIEELFAVEEIGELRLKGIARPVTAYNVANANRA